jgi:hypothetical protein
MFTFGVRLAASVIIRAIQPLTEGETANLKQKGRYLQQFFTSLTTRRRLETFTTNEASLGQLSRVGQALTSNPLMTSLPRSLF